MPPRITRAPQATIMSKKGEPVTAECAATGHPKPNITWTRKNNMLLPNGKPTESQRLLPMFGRKSTN